MKPPSLKKTVSIHLSCRI